MPDVTLQSLIGRSKRAAAPKRDRDSSPLLSKTEDRTDAKLPESTLVQAIGTANLAASPPTQVASIAHNMNLLAIRHPLPKRPVASYEHANEPSATPITGAVSIPSSMTICSALSSTARKRKLDEGPGAEVLDVGPPPMKDEEYDKQSLAAKDHPLRSQSTTCVDPTLEPNSEEPVRKKRDPLRGQGSGRMKKEAKAAAKSAAEAESAGVQTPAWPSPAYERIRRRTRKVT